MNKIEKIYKMIKSYKKINKYYKHSYKQIIINDLKKILVNNKDK